MPISEWGCHCRSCSNVNSIISFFFVFQFLWFQPFLLCSPRRSSDEIAVAIHAYECMYSIQTYKPTQTILSPTCSRSSYLHSSWLALTLCCCSCCLSRWFLLFVRWLLCASALVPSVRVLFSQVQRKRLPLVVVVWAPIRMFRVEGPASMFRDYLGVRFLPSWHLSAYLHSSCIHFVAVRLQWLKRSRHFSEYRVSLRGTVERYIHGVCTCG